METITLWTRQVPQVWEQLRREGAYQVKEAYIRQKNSSISDYYLKLYRWYTKTARRYLTIGEDQEYPPSFCNKNKPSKSQKQPHTF